MPYEMKKILIPILLGFALLAVSCEKNLDIPQKAVVSTLEFYSNDDDARAALANMYAQYIENVAGTPGIYVPELMILNYSSDDVYAAGKNFDDHGDFRGFDEFKYDPANPALKELYNRYYYAIYHANLIISNFTTENRNGEQPKFESKFTEQCVAEARVMRAYLHMMAAMIWNQPIVMDRIYEADEELPVNTDKTQSEILKWVVSECEKAIASGSLPVRKGTSDKDATARMSLGFAQFIAGKAAVYNNDMETARKYLGALIASKNYALVPSEDFWTNFHIAGDGNSEKIFAPNIFDDATLFSARSFNSWFTRDRWMVANTLNWRLKSLLGVPKQCIGTGWGGGSIQEDFAEKFYQHDGDSPRRKATFLTEDEFLYEMEWNTSKLNDASLEEKKSDPNRGLAVGGLFGRGKYFEWKNMAYKRPPKLLTGGKDYPSDNLQTGAGENSNATNLTIARYAEALLLYAEACVGSGDAAKGLAALNEVQERSGSGKISKTLTFEDVMEEKQYELWFENCRFIDLVRWSKLGKVNLDDIFNKSGMHKNVPTVHDEFSESGKEGFQKYHKFYVTHDPVPGNSTFVVGKHEYLPFPRDVKTANPSLHDVGGWASGE